MGGIKAGEQELLREQKLLERIFTDSSQPLELLVRQFCQQEGVEDFRFGVLGVYGGARDSLEQGALFEAFHEIIYYIPLPELTLLLLRPGGDCQGTAGRISQWLQDAGRPRPLAYMAGDRRLPEARQLRADLESAAAEIFFQEETACVALPPSARKRVAFHSGDVRRLRQLQREIAAAATCGEADRVRQLLSAYFAVSARGGPAAFREWCLRLYLHIEAGLELPGGEPGVCPEGGPDRPICQMITEAGTAAEIAGRITGYLDLLLCRRQPPWRDTACRVVSYVEDYIKNHYMEAISIADIAVGVDLSANYVRSVFKSSRGVTIQSFLTDYRLRMACQLLRNTVLKVSRVGQMVGYSNVSYFCAAFQKRFGKTPSEWRAG